MSLNDLFTPFSIESLKLENRIVMPPMATNYTTPEGFVTDRQIAYYVERAKGGVGYITTEHTGILPQGKASPKMMMIHTDEHGAKIKNLVEAVHAAGGKIVVQINHAGRQTSSEITGMPIVGASPIPGPPKNEIPRELSVGEIEEIIEAFSVAAQRVKEVGADGVEIHMAHGYLICSFLSPFTNKRSDRYGGDVQGRSRLAVEVLQSVRSRIGPDFPIICRLSADEYLQGGLRIEETKQIAKTLEEKGANALHISACNVVTGYLNQPPYYVEEGVFVHLAEAVKAQVDIPVITVGRIRSPLMADQIIRDGKADLISMGRALIADPHLPQKAKDGRLEEIIPCISCNKCIQTQRQGAIRCSVNPETGNEAEFRFEKADRSKNVWIVGGGPGGLKAAEIAALRGHQVTLFERKDKLGGRVRLGANPPGKAVLNEFIDYLEGRVRALGITLEMDKEFTADMITSGEPDVVIVATGASPQFPDWKGVEESDALSVDDVLSDWADIGDNVLIVGGGGTGAEIADLLSEVGKKVTLIEMLEDIASDLINHLQHYLKQRLSDKGVNILTSTRVVDLGKGYAMVEDASGIKKLDGFDDIVLALGSETPNDVIYKDLEDKVAELYVIGDASQPRAIVDAVWEGEDIAIRI
jgi:2,4-dienoyl-CoA reductase-like NADH-dependent reductase (Old Yellow Enzyme family)/thioredoxin reductase